MLRLNIGDYLIANYSANWEVVLLIVVCLWWCQIYLQIIPLIHCSWLAKLDDLWTLSHPRPVKSIWSIILWEGLAWLGHVSFCQLSFPRTCQTFSVFLEHQFVPCCCFWKWSITPVSFSKKFGEPFGFVLLYFAQSIYLLEHPTS